MSIVKLEPIKNIITIKLINFNLQFVNIKFINEYTFNLNYKSPSIFLNGIYLQIPNYTINNCLLFNTQNKKQKILLINNENINNETSKFIDILIKINRKISENLHKNLNIKTKKNNAKDQNKFLFNQKSFESVNDIFIENLMSGNKNPPNLNLITNNKESYKAFIKNIKTKSNQDYYLIVINNYLLNETIEEFNSIKKDIYLKMDNVENKYNYYYCRTTLDYKNL